MTAAHPPSSTRIPAVNQNRPKSAAPPPPTSRSSAKRAPAPQVSPDIDADITAAVEAQLAEQRAQLTAKLLAEREEKRKKEAAAAARKEAAKRDEEEFSPEVIAKFSRMLAAAGMAVVPANLAPAVAPVSPVPVPPRRPVPADVSDSLPVNDVPDNDYSDTERVQLELLALLDLLGVVRVRDVQEHIRRPDGSVMSASNVRYHMKKLANRGLVKKAEEVYSLPGLGHRTRDVWSRDPQLLLEVLEGKKIVRQ